jgi:hypothetical protein
VTVRVETVSPTWVSVLEATVVCTSALGHGAVMDVVVVKMSTTAVKCVATGVVPVTTSTQLAVSVAAVQTVESQ